LAQLNELKLSKEDIENQLVESKKEINTLSLSNDDIQKKLDEEQACTARLLTEKDAIALELRSTTKQLKQLTKTHKGTVSQLKNIQNQLVESKKEINTLSLSNDELQKKFDEEQECIAKLKLLSTEKDGKYCHTVRKLMFAMN
jgi:chromosome segregation ATPase